MARPSNRERILDAFEQTLIERGSAEATLETVAEAAGVSKGGLLYHFGTKDELFTAFGDRLADRIDDATAQAPEDPGGLVRWYLDPTPMDEADQQLSRTVLAALHGAETELTGVIRGAFERYAEPLSVLPPTLRDQVRLIGDGLFLGALVGADPPAGLDTIIDELVVRAQS